jgi:hypothetical protein
LRFEDRSMATTNLKGRVALVTGAGTGIGRAIALALGNAGATSAYISTPASREQKRTKHDRLAPAHQKAQSHRLRWHDHAGSLRTAEGVFAAEPGFAAQVTLECVFCLSPGHLSNRLDCVEKRANDMLFLCLWPDTPSACARNWRSPKAIWLPLSFGKRKRSPGPDRRRPRHPGSE